MSLRINETAPDFTADTTHGPVGFHDAGDTRVGRTAADNDSGRLTAEKQLRLVLQPSDS